MLNQLIINNYPMFGLNHHRHFLTPPICDCGCGKPMYVYLDDEIAVREFCIDMLNDYDCDNSAIFAVFNNGQYMAVWKCFDFDKEEMTYLAATSDDIHMFAELDGEYRFCCYNLIIEEQDGEWMIQE